MKKYHFLISGIYNSYSTQTFHPSPNIWVEDGTTAPSLTATVKVEPLEGRLLTSSSRPVQNAASVDVAFWTPPPQSSQCKLTNTERRSPTRPSRYLGDRIRIKSKSKPPSRQSTSAWFEGQSEVKTEPSTQLLRPARPQRPSAVFLRPVRVQQFGTGRQMKTVQSTSLQDQQRVTLMQSNIIMIQPDRYTMEAGPSVGRSTPEASTSLGHNSADVFNGNYLSH